jgi:Zn-dependent M16 (insulinase) family peptidase
VEFPEDDESMGEIGIAFFGPNCTDLISISALQIISTYLTGSSVAILENVIVEKEELASSVGGFFDSRPNSVLWLQPTGVETEKLAFVEQRVISLLKEVAENPLDMNYMQECIKREERQIKLHAESSESFYATHIITDFLFGKRDGSTLADLQTLREYEVLSKWTDEQWRAFLKEWVSDAPHISILGKPSAKLAEDLKQAEKERVEKRKGKLGPDGLKKLAEKVEEAKKQNDQKIPEHVLDKWEVPGTESIHFIDSATARSGKARDLGVLDNSAQKIIDKAAPGAPVFVQFEHVPSNFVTLTIHIGTADTAVELKPLLSLFGDYFFNSPILRDGKRVEFEEVVKELESDTISYRVDSGRSVGDYESTILQFQFEPTKYASLIKWITELMFDSIFDPPRLKACISKNLADIPENKRDGRLMAQEVDATIHAVKKHLPVAKSNLVKAVYLRRLKKWLAAEPGAVVERFEALRSSLFTFQNIRILVAADVAKLEHPVAAWDALAARMGNPPKEMTPITAPVSMLSEEGKAPGSVGTTIIPMTTLDSSYSVSTASGLRSFADPRLPAFLVAVGYLEAVEGPLWNAVRGNGLAYGTSFSREVDGGYLQYRVYRSPDASKALLASRAAVGDLASGAVPLDRHLVQGAVSGIVMAFADERETMAAAAQQNFVRGVVRGLPENWSRDIMKAVRDVTFDEIRSVMQDVIMPVFEPGKSNVVVTCAPLLTEV